MGDPSDYGARVTWKHKSHSRWEDDFGGTFPPLATNMSTGPDACAGITIMPYACLLFADNVDRFMRVAANSIAEGSSFEPHPIFHVPVIGSLHHYTAKDVAGAASRATADKVVLSFRFGRWELSGSLLRATVESTSVRELAGHMQRELPLGRPWASSYVTVGSVATIDKERREEFLAAVEAAFPIDPQIEYSFKGHVEYNNHNVATHKPAAIRLPRHRRTQTQQPARSPHRKWACEAGTTCMDTSSTDTGLMGANVTRMLPPPSAGIIKSSKSSKSSKATRTSASRAAQAHGRPALHVWR
uniref:Uncharacterized protein n=1 Tax=Haptolina brevifila TaxID=156173 RepID=A0A7S2CMH4_9EUKA|mmetsp:Transcript_26744/g.53738  ORF Transcript_26744/g.53738 Transcript_26744/m.53738 type:complete len:300 (+) Transcript_26744:240-1139(+)